MLPQHLSAGLLSFVRFADYKPICLSKASDEVGAEKRRAVWEEDGD